MTRAELKKLLVVEKILEGHMTNKEGAAALGLTDRQVIRLKKKYQEKRRSTDACPWEPGQKSQNTLYR